MLVLTADAHIVDLIRSYADSRNISVTYASRILTGSGDTCSRLTAGMSMTGRRINKILQRASDLWPADLPWPSDIARPDPSPDSPAARSLEDRPHTVADALERRDACLARGDEVGAAAAKTRAVELARERPDILPDFPVTGALLGMIARRERALKLDRRRRLSATAVCELLGVERHVFDAAIREYGNGKPKADRMPSPKSQVGRMVAALIEAGDERFQNRRNAT